MKKNDIKREIAWFADPLFEAASSPDQLASFFKEFGYELNPSDVTKIVAGFQSLMETINSIFQNEDDANDSVNAKDLIQLFDALKSLGEDDIIERYFGADFFNEIFDYLLLRYFSIKHPVAYALLFALGVIEIEQIVPAYPAGRPLAYARIKFDWTRIIEFLSDNPDWAKKVYGWAGNPNAGDEKHLDHSRVLNAIVLLIESIGFSLSTTTSVSQTELSAFLKNARESDHILVVVPVFQDDIDDVDDKGRPLFLKEAGFRILPYGDISQPQNLGIAIAPYANGDVSGVQKLSDRLALSMSIPVKATGGAYITMTPEGVSNNVGGSLDGKFEFAFTYSNPGDAVPLMLTIDTAKVGALAIRLVIAGNIKGAFGIGVGFKGLDFTVDISKDGLLSNFFAEPIKVKVGDVLVGWDTTKGVYFESGDNLGLRVPLHLEIGPIKIFEAGLTFDFINTPKLIFHASGKLDFGPLTASIQSFGISSSVVPAPIGVLGNYDLRFAFHPPTGLSLTLNAQGLTGGGFLSFREDLGEYKGGLVFEFQKLFTFRAIGIINTKLPGGEPGFSLFIMITGQFPPVQLSFGFTLTGLGGLFGYNRTIDADVLNQMVRSGRAANLLFPPADTDLNQIVNDAGQAFPVQVGNFVFGPMAKIGWGTPTIITAEIGLAIEVPDPVRVAMLGVIRVTLPEPEAPVARLNMVFVGILDFSRKLFTLQATLFDSQLLSFTLTGDFAMYISWGQQPLFIFSAGGFHPAYKEAPPQLNALRRLSLTLIDTQELKIGVQTYLALTSNTVQIGARAQVWGKTAIAEFNGLLWFDVLFQLDPFQFQAEAQLIAGVKIFGQDIAAVHLTAVLTGPGPWHFRGHGYVEIARLKKEVRRELAWGIQAPNLAPPSVDVWEMLKPEVAKKENWQSVPLPDSSLSGISIRDLSQEKQIVLLPNVQLTFKQKLVPLGVELQKFGNAIPQQRSFRVTGAQIGIKPLDTRDIVRVDELFAPASFLQLSDAEKLSRPSFEKMQGGVAIRPTSTSGEVRGTPTECLVAYELKYVRAKEIIPQKAHMPLSPAEMLQEARSGSSFRSPLSREQTRPSYAAVASVMPIQEGFVLVQGRELSPLSENGKPLFFTSQTEAYQKRQKLDREDLLVMSTFEMEN